MKYYLILMLFPILLFSQTISVFNASSVADLIEQKVSKIKSFKGNFTYKKDNKVSTGSIIYVAPHKLNMEILSSDGSAEPKRIICDGINMMVQQGDLIARQRLMEDTHPLKAWSISRLRYQYIPTAPASGLETMYANVAAYKIIFEPKLNTTNFRTIEMIVDTQGLMRFVKAVSRLGITTELTLSYREFNRDYFNKEFEVVTTEKSQIYDNIFE